MAGSGATTAMAAATAFSQVSVTGIGDPESSVPAEAGALLSRRVPRLGGCAPRSIPALAGQALAPDPLDPAHVRTKQAAPSIDAQRAPADPPSGELLIVVPGLS